MIIATEVGKDPLLRQAIRNAFKTDEQGRQSLERGT
jgi:hypothetical protein